MKPTAILWPAVGIVVFILVVVYMAKYATFHGGMSVHERAVVVIRWVVLIATLGFTWTKSPMYIAAGMVAIGLVFVGLMVYVRVPSSVVKKEGFRADDLPSFAAIGGQGAANLYLENQVGNPRLDATTPHQIDVANRGAGGAGAAADAVPVDAVMEKEFAASGWRNPLGNMLLPEIKYDAERKSAPPSFNVDVSRDITRNIKRAVQHMNPGIRNTDKQLFGDLYNEFMQDQSARLWYSTANTRVGNDQGAFARFLYSDLKYSGKESTAEGALARIQDNYRYILY